MTRKELQKKIRENAAEINKFAAEFSKSQEPLVVGFIEQQQEKFRILTGSTRGRTKTSLPTGKISSLKKADLEKILSQQEKFLKSKVLTKEGRDKIFEKQYETFLKNRPEVSASKDTLLDIQKFFMQEPRIYEELVESHQFDSEQVVSLVLGGYSAEEILDALKKIESSPLKNSIRRGRWKNFVKAVLREPEKGVDEIAKIYSKRA